MAAGATADVLVIGAGISGLTTAFILSRLGVIVRVVEAASRAGGRILPEDAGGSWVSLACRLVSLGEPG